VSAPFTVKDLQQAGAKPLTVEDLRQNAASDPNVLESAVSSGIEASRRLGMNAVSGFVGGSLGTIDHYGANMAQVLDGSAQALSNATGLSYGGAFHTVEQHLRKDEEALMAQAQALSPGDTPLDKAVQMIGGLPGAVASAVAAVGAGGPVLGFAGLGALGAADQGFWESAKAAVAGGLLGSVFKATEVGIGRTARAVTVGTGSAALDMAQGKKPEEVALSAGANALFAAWGARPPRKYTGVAPQAIPEEKPRLSRMGTLSESTLPTQGNVAETAPAGKPSALVVTPRIANAAVEFMGRDYSDITPPDRVMNLNLNRIEGPQEFKAATADFVNSFRDQIDQARRGTISHEQTVALARDLGLTVEKLMERRKGQALNAEEATAYRTMNRSSLQQWQELATKIKDNKATNEDKAAFLKATAVSEAIIEQTLGATAEAGRALSSFNIRVGPSTVQMKHLRELLTDWKGPKGESLEDFASRVAAVDSPEGLAQMARNWRKVTTGDKLMEVWINGLFSPPGIVANALSNSFMAAWAPLQTTGAALSSKIRGVPSSSPENVSFREAFAQIHGMVEGTGDGLRLAAKVFRTETAASPTDLFGPATTMERPFGAIGTAPNSTAFARRAGQLIRIPSRTLMSMDAFAQAMAYRQSLRAQSVRMALSEGKRGASLASRVDEILRNPSEEQTGVAYRFARRQTFTEELGATGRAIQQFANSHNLARMILPFTRTPINIFKMSLRSTPMAPMLAEVRSELKQSGVARDMVLGQMAMGGMMAAWTAYKAANDEITGSGPSNKVLRDVWLTNHQPFSIKVGSSWVSYARVEPFATVMGLAADYSDISGHLNDPEREDLATALMFSFRRNLASKTFLQGLSSAVEAMMDPVHQGPRFVQGLAGSIVPSPVATYAHMKDPVLRDTRSMIDRIRSRIPGYSADLPPRRNVFGEPILLYGGVGPDMVSPLYRRPLPNDATFDEAVRLEARFIPPAPGEDINGIEVSPQEYSDLMADYGPKAKATMDALISSPSWNYLEDGLKRKILEDVYADARTAGRKAAYARILIHDPARIQQTIEKKLTEAGVSLR
jgi:hypothetical protein